MILTVYELVNLMEKEYADDFAYQYFEGSELVKVTYGQYVKDIRKFASYLCDRYSDIEGKRVGLIARNSYHFMVCYLGTILAKAIIVPLNKQESWDIVDYEVKLGDLTCLFSDGEYEEIEPKLKETYGDMMLPLKDYINYSGKEYEFSITDPDIMSAILMTSGTTGKNKGVMLSQRNMFTSLKSFTDQIEFMQKKLGRKKIQSFILVPMYHTGALATILSGNIMGNFEGLCNSPKYIMRDLKVMRSDYIFVVPSMLKLWHKDLSKGRTESLCGINIIFTGAGPTDPNFFDVFMEHGITMVQIYGLTESFGGGTINNSDMDPGKIESIGNVKYDCELKIIDREICFKSASSMLGYVKDEEGTKEALADGWLHTGDLGYIDEDGYLFINGRKKNLIVLSGGENVNPEELENLLLRNDKIIEAIAKEKGDKICAEIFCDEKYHDEIKAYVKDVNRTLPGYKRMTAVEFRNEPFRKTGIGKIIR